MLWYIHCSCIYNLLYWVIFRQTINIFITKVVTAAFKTDKICFCKSIIITDCRVDYRQGSFFNFSSALQSRFVMFAKTTQPYSITDLISVQYTATKSFSDTPLFLSWRSACSLLLAFLSITAQCTSHVRSCEMTIPSSLNSLARFTTVLPITMGLHTQLLYSRKSTAIVLHFLDLISCYDCSHTDGCPPRGSS